MTSLGETSEQASYPTFQIIGADDEDTQAQVTSVSQLSDVQPTDWAFQALQSLVERYGCIAGYPDATFRGNRAATRYELAAALNACLDNISDRFATQEDLEALRALQEEFATELATLRGRVDSLEARTATLEAQQFSTTTKLVGEAIFQGTRTNNVTPIPAGYELLSPLFGSTGNRIAVNYRATLNFITSFTGKDLLITSLQQGSYAPAIFSSDGGLQDLTLFGTAHNTLAPSLNQVSDTNIGLYYLGYRFPFANDRGMVFATATGGELSDFTDTLNPFFDSDGQGSLSGFGIRNPIYRHISGRISAAGFENTSGTGIGLNYDVTDKVNLAIGYLATTDSAARPTEGGPLTGSGFIGGDYAAIAQLTFKPVETLGIGLTYVRSESDLPPLVAFGGGSGTFRANNPFLFTPTSANSAGLQFAWQASSRFALSGWAGATFAKAEAAGTLGGVFDRNGVFRPVARGDDATILNFALAAAFPDLFGTGNMGGLIFGVEPQVVSSSIPGYRDPDLNFHIEGLYRIRINDNISVTPGVIVVINPEGNRSNDPVVIGTVRTTFSF
ncbi:iron uptake porin [Synechococcales cyanobacterium C]|uniref:Iron uptake porin n=2 Tax=Petrachloros TaxID=2918834 RepID=A0A8K2A787_9CYAN|nr:iron uptake porin [Petrachloros mirabilis ULC683]